MPAEALPGGRHNILQDGGQAAERVLGRLAEEERQFLGAACVGRNVHDLDLGAISMGQVRTRTSTKVKTTLVVSDHLGDLKLSMLALIMSQVHLSVRPVSRPQLLLSPGPVHAPRLPARHFEAAPPCFHRTCSRIGSEKLCFL